MKKLIVLLVMSCLATMSMAQIVVMDPTTNNGSFEDPVGGDWANPGPGAVPGWNEGPVDFWMRTLAFDGAQAIVANAGTDGPHTYFSDVLAVPVPAGWTVDFSAAIGWAGGYADSLADPLADFGQSLRLYAVNPGDALDRALLSTISGTAAGEGLWATPSDSVVMPAVNDNWHFQVEVDSGIADAIANPGSSGWGNLLDDVRVVATPEPASLLLLGLGGVSLLRRRKKA